MLTKETTMKTVLATLLLVFLPLVAWSQEAIPVVRSDSGQADFQGSHWHLVAALLADYQKTLKEWDRPDSVGVPKIDTKTKFVAGDTVVPFITFASSTPVNEPLLVDADLILPDGTVSPSDHSPGVVLAKKILGDGNLYREETIFGFGLSKRYPTGTYVVRLKVYSPSTVICVFEERFELN